ncbi:MAG TPA: cellulase family glycosylhydrolase [Holophagaceae bacterium]|nr:cellulase family glycosylhydrolase [Holophagaceae bacterium]
MRPRKPLPAYSESRRRMLATLAGALALSACGGGSGSGATPTPPAGGTPPRLRLSGPDILAPDGSPLKLRGWNWGRWGLAQPTDAADNATQGATCVRIPLRWWGYYEGVGIDSRDDSQTATAGIDAGHLAILDAMVAQASAAKLWIILFIDSDCGQNGTQDAHEIGYCDPSGLYPNGHNFWTDAGARAKFIRVWKFIAARYKDTPYLGFFEPLPEPNPTSGTDADITAFYDEVMAAIRTVAPGVPFLLGPRVYGMKSVDLAYNAKWQDVVYTGNLFLRTSGTHDENIAELGLRLQNLLDLQSAHQVPIFVQQCGVNSGDDPDLSYLNAMLTLLNTKGVGYTYWEYRDTLNSNAYGVIYQDGMGGWITKQGFLDTIAGYLKA